MTRPEIGGLPDGPPLIIAGASTRAAAHSAVRAGMRPHCIDLFGDVDLRSIANVVTLSDYPHGLPPAVDALPPSAGWMYTGGLENHPRVVETISRKRQLFGNGRGSLALVRDPWWLASRLQAAGLPALELWPRDERPPPADRAWLCKPLFGSGGRGIVVWDAVTLPKAARCYFQKRQSGATYSAAFLGSAGRATLLGITRQLVGERGVHAAPFTWCGNVTPVALDATIAAVIQRIGETIASEAGLCGLFGCDFVLEGSSPYLTEVNPRYTGSMELLDHLLGRSLVGWHVRSCGTSPCPEMISEISDRKARVSKHSGPRVLGKIVLFADCDRIAGDATGLLLDPRDDRLPLVADLPSAGQRIAAGEPVCSLFASDRTEEACIARLLRCAQRFRQRFVRAAE